MSDAVRAMVQVGPEQAADAVQTLVQAGMAKAVSITVEP